MYIRRLSLTCTWTQTCRRDIYAAGSWKHAQCGCEQALRVLPPKQLMRSSKCRSSRAAATAPKRHLPVEHTRISVSCRLCAGEDKGCCKAVAHFACVKSALVCMCSLTHNKHGTVGMHTQRCILFRKFSHMCMLGDMPGCLT